MKHTITLALAFCLCSIAHAQPDQRWSNPDKYYWPMFHREAVVTLEGLEIPAACKRTKITDTQGRVLQGEWLAIDRTEQIVKFRRTPDRKELDIPFKTLCEPDRRYAELETGMTWEIGEPTPVPVDMIQTPKSDPNQGGGPLCIHLLDPSAGGSNPFVPLSMGQQKLSSALVIDNKQVRVTWEVSPQEIKTSDLPLDLLTDNDRALIKEQTGVEVPVVPHQEWSLSNIRYWRYVQDGTSDNGKPHWKHHLYRFGQVMPKYIPGFVYEGKDSQTGKVTSRVPLVRTTFAYMDNAFTPEEIFDHLRVRTLTSDFLYQEAAHTLQKNLENQLKNDPGAPPLSNIKTFEEVMAMLATKEPETETVSLKAAVAATGVKPFEEPTPAEAPNKPNIGRPNGPPVDGQLQGLHFIAQFQHVVAGRPKVPFATLFNNMEIRGISRGGNQPGYLSFDDEAVRDAIQKHHGMKVWQLPSFFPSGLPHEDPSDDLQSTIYLKLIRQHLRNKQLPMIACIDKMNPNKLTGFAILTGFTVAAGKETTYEAILLEGPVGLGQFVQQDNGSLAYKVREATITQSEISSFLRQPFVSSKN